MSVSARGLFLPSGGKDEKRSPENADIMPPRGLCSPGGVKISVLCNQPITEKEDKIMKKRLIAVIALLMVCMFSIPAYAADREAMGPPGWNLMHHFPFGRPICWEFVDRFLNEGTIRLYFVNICPGRYLFSGVQVVEVGGPPTPRSMPIHGSAQIIGDRIKMAATMVDTIATDPAFACQVIAEIDLDPVSLEATAIGTVFCSGIPPEVPPEPPPEPVAFMLYGSGSWTPCECE